MSDDKYKNIPTLDNVVQDGDQKKGVKASIKEKRSTNRRVSERRVSKKALEDGKIERRIEERRKRQRRAAERKEDEAQQELESLEGELGELQFFSLPADPTPNH